MYTFICEIVDGQYVEPIYDIKSDKEIKNQYLDTTQIEDDLGIKSIYSVEKSLELQLIGIGSTLIKVSKLNVKLTIPGAPTNADLSQYFTPIIYQKIFFFISIQILTPQTIGLYLKI